MALQIGMIGTGWFSKVHADLLAAAEGVKVRAFLGTSKEKAERMALSYGAAGYGDLTEMLDTEQLDAAYVCVPPMSHGAIERELIRRRIPFLVEKPLGLDAELPRSIMTEVEETGLITSVGYHFRYQSNVDRMRELLRRQQSGMVLGRWMDGMPGVAWWRKQNGSGGQFIEQTTHLADLLRYLAGEVQEVYALYGSRVKHEQEEGVDVADVGTVTLKLESGLIANISNTCILPAGTEADGVGLAFYTDQGVLDWNPQRLCRIQPGERTEYRESTNPYQKETEAFLHALRTGDRSRIRSDYADAFKTQAVTCAALESAGTGKPVRVGYE
ncbi:hypothetical protein J2TS6_41790 [Paenibacillus albilobatus]|uniref:Gfo/Idh/MocA family oxidoreductase n=1 Tax=Paenibacillus albilobatus TaxID=2716884 RepID=A0A919XKG6_9BACL|nr:Gfo/Idh/MocA family oxidoreductase [Paenibacillus albilobatus]GIO33038.1 hypothetical protein J2TS6_41790 [Paenibacillus albilobatus]